MRLYAKNTITFESKNGEKMTSIVINGAVQANKNGVCPTGATANYGTVTPTSFTTSTTEITWAKNDGSTNVTITINGTAGNIKVTNFVITYEPAGPSSSVTFENATPSINFPAQNTYTQVASTASGYTGTVNYEITENTAGATIEGPTVTVTKEGSVTVKATAPAITGFAKSETSYTLTVTDTRQASVTTIDDSELVNTDVYTSTIAGKLHANVTADGSAVDGATITWESSDPTVATIDADGNVTLVKAGTTTITASFAGDGDYSKSSDTYELTVTDSNAPLLYESVSKYDSESDSSTKINSTNATNYLNDYDKWNISEFSDAYPGKGGCFKLGTSSKTGTITTNVIALNGCGKLTFQAKQYKDGESGPLYITVTGADASGDIVVTGTANFEKYTVNLNNATGHVVISFATHSKRMYLDEIKLVKVEKVTAKVGAKGFATLASDYALDFTGKSIKAYTISSTDGSKLTLTQKMKVAKGEPVLLYSETANDSQEIPVIAETEATADPTNKLVRGTDEAITWSETEKFYVLNTTDTPAFYRANNSLVAASKAYLDLTGLSANARSFTLSFGNETLGITEANRETMTDNRYYNLNGQRMTQPTKGLYIINGKKVMMK